MEHLRGQGILVKELPLKNGGSLDELLKSINEKLYTLPDDTVVWPGHDYGSIPHSTIKREKDTNPYTRIW